MTLHDDHEELPEELRKELGEMFRPKGKADARRDAVILAAARRAGEVTPLRRWRWVVGAGLAAAVAVAATLWWVHPGGPSGSAGVSADAGHHGPMANYQRTGDIRDAYYVARKIKAGQALEASWDVNRDGRVDAADATELAMAAVRVEKESGKGATQ